MRGTLNATVNFSVGAVTFSHSLTCDADHLAISPGWDLPQGWVMQRSLNEIDHLPTHGQWNTWVFIANGPASVQGQSGTVAVMCVEPSVL